MSAEKAVPMHSGHVRYGFDYRFAHLQFAANSNIPSTPKPSLVLLMGKITLGALALSATAAAFGTALTLIVS